MTAAAKSDVAEASAGPGGRAVLAVLLLSVFLVGVDATAMILAGAVIERQLHLSVSTFNIAVTCYQLALGLLVVTSGRLGDVFGQERMLRVALVAFAVASIATGLSFSAVQLVASRAVQGAAAALISPQVMALVRIRYEGEARARALGQVASVIGGASLIGPLFGGLLLSVNAGGWAWRLIFLINIPLCGLALAFLSRLPAWPRSDAGPQRMDAPGVLLLTGVLLTLLLPLSVPSLRHGWVLPASLALCAVLAVLLYRVERRKTRDGAQPILDGNVIGSPRFKFALLAGAAVFFGMGGFSLTVPQFLQREVGLTPLLAACVTASSAVGSGIMSLTAGRLERRMGTARLPAGGLITLAAVIAMAAVTAVGGRSWIAWALGPLALLSGVGLGMMLPGLTFVIMSVMPASAAGAGNGVAMTNQMLARGAGYSLIGALYASLYPVAGARSTSAFAWVFLVLTGCFLASAAVGVVLQRTSEHAP